MSDSSVHKRVSEALAIDIDLAEAGVTATTRTLGRGETLINRGDEVGDVFVVLGGTLEVVGFDDQLLAVLGDGSVVGEVAALAGGVRTATVRSVDVTEVAVINAADFENLLSTSPDLYERISTEAIRRLDHRWLSEFVHWLLGSADPQLVDAISMSVTWRRVNAGEQVYSDGEVAEGGYAIIRGRIRITHGGPSRTVSYEVGKGGLIGEEGLVDEVVRTDSAVAVRDSVVVEVPRSAFLALMEAYPKVVASVLANLMRQRAQDKRSPHGSSFVLVSHDLAFGKDIRLQLVKALEAFGTTSWVSSELADELLSKTGVAQSEGGTPGDARVSQLLYEMEQAAEYIVFEADIGSSAWSRRAIRQADTVIVAVHSNTPAALLESIDEQLDRDLHGGLVLAVFHPDGTNRPSSTRRFVDRWNPDFVVHVADANGLGLAGLARLLAGRSTGLVLGGGGARGFAHLGVWRALKEHGVEIDFVGGASMGAAMGALMATGAEVDEVLAEVEEAFSGLLDYTVPLVSLVKGKRAAKALNRSLGGWRIEDLWIPYFCTSTNLTHSNLVVHHRGDLTRAIRASVAIPGVFPPMTWESDLLVDSGVLNNLPADVMRTKMPNGTLIAVDVAPSVGPGSHTDLGMYVSATQVVRSRFSRESTRYPRLMPVLLRSMITASMRERDRTVDRGDIDLYLNLDMRGVSLLDFDVANAVVKAGYEAASPQIEAWLGQERDTSTARP